MDLPTYFDPKTVDQVWTERAGLVQSYADQIRRTTAVKPAQDDAVRIAAFGIDCQIGFCSPGASLFVPGAVEDIARAVSFIYRNVESLTTLVFSLDTHSVNQIFHPAFWRDKNGDHPAPFSIITRADVAAGLYVPADPRALSYLDKLEAQNKYRLTIWPYHALLGGVSHALVPALMEASIFHALVRGASTVFETKGTHPLTENYSVLAPEVDDLDGTQVGCFNDALFDRLLTYDKIYVFGQAKSHCVLATLQDLGAHMQQKDPALLRRIYVLTDAMSPVPAPPLDPLPPALDFPAVATRAFERLADMGMHMVTTADAI